MHLLNKAREYCNAVGCRRRILLKYFQEEAPGPDRSGTVACCDNCRQAASGGAAGLGGADARVPRDVTREAAMLLMAVRECGESYGLGMVRGGPTRFRPWFPPPPGSAANFVLVFSRITIFLASLPISPWTC